MQLCYGELHGRATALAEKLSAWGLRAGQVVATDLPNVAEGWSSLNLYRDDAPALSWAAHAVPASAAANHDLAPTRAQPLGGLVLELACSQLGAAVGTAKNVEGLIKLNDAVGGAVVGAVAGSPDSWLVDVPELPLPPVVPAEGTDNDSSWMLDLSGAATAPSPIADAGTGEPGTALGCVRARGAHAVP